MKLNLEKKVVVSAIASILVPVVAGFLPEVGVDAIEAVVMGVVGVVVTFVAGYLTKHTKRTDLPADER